MVEEYPFRERERERVGVFFCGIERQAEEATECGSFAPRPDTSAADQTPAIYVGVQAR